MNSIYGNNDLQLSLLFLGMEMKNQQTHQPQPNLYLQHGLLPLHPFLLIPVLSPLVLKLPYIIPV